MYRRKRRNWLSILDHCFAYFNIYAMTTLVVLLAFMIIALIIMGFEALF